MKSAAEWASLWWGYEFRGDFIAAVQRDAIEECARLTENEAAFNLAELEGSADIELRSMAETLRKFSEERK